MKAHILMSEQLVLEVVRLDADFLLKLDMLPSARVVEKIEYWLRKI